MRVASPTFTRITRCVPPLRSRPRRIGSFERTPGMSTTTKTTRIATISAIFHQRLRFKISSGSRLLRLTSLSAGDRGTGDFHFDVICNSEVNDVRLNTLDRSVNPTSCNDAIPFFQRAQHLLRFPLLFVRRADDEEIENEKNRRDRKNIDQKSDRGIAAGLKQS